MKKVKAKKYLGQHFLNDSKIANDITNLISKSTKNVLEVGPGMGMLTQFLINNFYTVQVVEIDPESVIYLRSNFPNLKIHEGDFLDLDIHKKYPSRFSLIGNFPYNISSQILLKILKHKNQIKEVIGMFQKEVAERIICLKGKQKGKLSVFVQAFYNVEYCFTVNEDLFTPPPKVKSAVIKLTRNSRTELSVDENKFKKVVKTAFNQKRKKLSNNLKSIKLIDKESIQDLLTLRAEQLSVDDFIKLTSHVR